MKTMSAAPAPTDPELVALARQGNTPAYGQLVSRHQTLVVSLAYSICGDFSRSQDIAQEAFIAAWQQLSSLEDAVKFKSWLCGITRNLGNNFIRQQTRRLELPTKLQDTAPDPAAEAPGPHEHAVTREESAIVWRALEQLPETYREPLILFYREHQSIERVAAALDLSPDTVKQRLSRGRAMLRDQVENLVERSLGFTTPGVLFTTAVLSALPVAANQIVATTLIATAAKGGATTKATGAIPWLSTLLSPFLAIPFISFLGTALSSHIIGRNIRSPEERKFMQRLMWSSGLIGNFALVAMLALSWWQFRGAPNHAPSFNSKTVTLITLGLLGVAVIGPAVIFFRSRKSILAYARNYQPPENMPRWRRKLLLGPGRASVYRSKLALFGLPLIDVRFGHSTEQPLMRGTAFGWIALGDIAHGVIFAAGGFAVGGIAIGSIAIGTISIGYLAIGLTAFGGIAVGGLAKGILISVGYIALGSIAVGWEAASGSIAAAKHIALGSITYAKTTLHTTTNDWEQTIPIVRTFKLTGIPELCFFPLLNVVITMLGFSAFTRHRSDDTRPQSDPSSRSNLKPRFVALLSVSVVALALLINTAVQRTARQLAAENDTSITRAREAVAHATDDETKAKARYELGKELLRTNNPAEALAEFLWCFDEGMVRAPSLTGVRLISLLPEIQAMAELYPPARSALLERRDLAQAAILAGHQGDLAVSDFVRLNNAIGEREQSLIAFDQLAQESKLRLILGRELFPQFLKAKRYRDAVQFEPFEKILKDWTRMQDVAHEVERRRILRSRINNQSIFSDDHDRAIHWLADRIEVLAGAGQLENARQLLSIGRTYDDTQAARTIYETSLGRAGQTGLCTQAP